jgi:predicted DCC family thiol-disulfide oxidoreductase YuxK
VKLDEIIVIYDGQCRFCIASLLWLQKKIQVSAIPFQGATPEKYGLSVEQCSKEVFVVTKGKTFAGAQAIAYLLKLRGNTMTSMVIRVSGPVGRSGYRWVAGHRNSLLVRIITKILERS